MPGSPGSLPLRPVSVSDMQSDEGQSVGHDPLVGQAIH